jgi:hypothetical protein
MDLSQRWRQCPDWLQQLLWGVHEITTDQTGNLFVAEVFNRRAQKFQPRKGADAAKLVGQQMRVAWKD